MPIEQDFRAQDSDAEAFENIVKASVPDDHELTAANIEVWRERRLPSAKRYLVASGRLLTVMGYDLQQGWHETHHSAAGSRTVVGIVTPHRHRTRTRSKTLFIEAPVTYVR